MNFDNLIVGKRYDNFRVLCKALGVEPKGGNSKIRQMDTIRRHIVFRKDNNAFIIEEIKETPDPKKDGRSKGNNTISYTKLLEKLILDLLWRNKNRKKILLSKSAMFRELGMVNMNYGISKNIPDQLFKKVNIPVDTIKDWYDSVDKMLVNNLVKALDSLKSEGKICWSKVYIIDVNTVADHPSLITTSNRYENGENNHREATKEESLILSNAESKVSKNNGWENKSKIVLYGKWKEFKGLVTDMAKLKIDINYYYEGYRIVPHTNVSKEKTKTDIRKHFLLDPDERSRIHSELNNEIIDRVRMNAENRKDKRTPIFGIYNNPRDSKTYLPECERLSSVLLDLNSDEILYD